MFDDDLISDLHKDAYGFRPNEGFWADWRSMGAAEKQATWDQLVSALQDAQRAEAEAETRAIAKFEKRVASLMAHGAKDRSMAIRWLMDASVGEGIRDEEYFCYLNGLPYNYFTVAKKQQA